MMSGTWRKGHWMKKKNLQITILLTALVILMGGVTLINYHWNESWKLFWYDLKNGFLGFGWLYPASLVTVFLLAAASVVILYFILIKKTCIKNVYNDKNMHKYTLIYIYIYNYTCIVILAICVSCPGNYEVGIKVFMGTDKDNRSLFRRS